MVTPHMRSVSPHKVLPKVRFKKPRVILLTLRGRPWDLRAAQFGMRKSQEIPGTALNRTILQSNVLNGTPAPHLAALFCTRSQKSFVNWIRYGPVKCHLTHLLA